MSDTWDRAPTQVVSRMGFWDGQCGPQTAVQRAATELDAALECVNEARHRLPGEVESALETQTKAIRKSITDLLALVKDMDGQWCEQCGGRWTDDPYHTAYCEPHSGVDERDQIREALASGTVYGGAPAPR